jgi:hypothetical protein
MLKKFPSGCIGGGPGYTFRFAVKDQNEDKDEHQQIVKWDGPTDILFTYEKTIAVGS